MRGGDTYAAAEEGHGVTEASFMGALARKYGMALGSFDLPSEAQWECACRAGTQSGLYSGEELPAAAEHYRTSKQTEAVAQLDGLAVYWKTSTAGGASMEAGTKAPNNYGLYDMYGNVGEMCLDKVAPWGKYNATTHNLANETTVDPVLSPGNSGTYRAMKGGTSDNYMTYAVGLLGFRSAARKPVGTTANARQIGFRACFNPAAAAVAE